MIVISGTVTVDPGDHDAAVELVGPLVQATLAEPGNVTYGFWAHPTVPGTFRVHEEWDDEASLNAHMTAPHFVEFMGAFGELRVTGTELYRHDVAETSRFM